MTQEFKADVNTKRTFTDSEGNKVTGTIKEAIVYEDGRISYSVNVVTESLVPFWEDELVDETAATTDTDAAKTDTEAAATDSEKKTE